MKFTKKVGVIIAGAALLTTSLVGLPVSAINYVHAQDISIRTYDAENPWTVTEKQGYKITGLNGYNNEYKVGQTLTLGDDPTFVDVQGANLTGTIKHVLTSPSNINITNEDNSKTYKLSERGTYVLYYVVVDANDKEIARSESVEIVVTGSNYEFEFPANQFFDVGEGEASKRLWAFLPNETSAKQKFAFTLPVPNVLLSKNKDEVKEGTLEIKVTSPSGKNVLTYASGNTYTTDDEYNDKVEAYDYNGGKVFKVNTREDEIGIYKVTYKFNDGTEENNEIEQTYDIQNRKSTEFTPDDEDDRVLSATLEGTGVPTKASIGSEVKIPTPKVTNTKNTSETVDFRTEMSVCFVDPNTGVEYQVEEGKTSEQGRTDISDDFTFIPTRKGGYRVYYKVFDAYGNETRRSAHLIANVSDSEAPEVKFVEDYKVESDGTVTDETVAKIKDGAHLLPERVNEGTYTAKYYNGGEDSKEYKGKIVLPAVYAIDNAASYKDITLKRTVKIKSGSFDNGLTMFTVADEWKKQNRNDDKSEKEYPGENSAVEILLEKAGEYTIEYSANDGSRTAYASYTVTVKGSEEDDELPNFDPLKVPYSYKPGAEIKFSKPTAVDNIDTRVLVETRYFFAKDAGVYKNEATEMTDDFLEEFRKLREPSNRSIDFGTKDKDDTANYYIDTNEATDNLYIVTIATDYYNRSVVGKTEGDTRTPKINVMVTVIKPDASVNDKDAVVAGEFTSTVPSSPDKIGYYNTSTQNFENVHQHYEVQLPSLKFTDKEDDNFDITVYVSEMTDEGLVGRTEISSSIKNGKGSDFVDGNYVRTVNGGKFVPAKAAKYLVTYVAVDAGGHVTSVSIPMIAKDTEKPSIIPQGYKETMELGESQEFYQAVITDNGERVYNPQDVVMFMVDYGDDRPEGVNPTNAGFNARAKTFTPKAIGEYHFKFSYKDAAGNVGESDLIKITVQDTIKPTIYFRNLTSNNKGVNINTNTNTYSYPDLEAVDNSKSEYKPIYVSNFYAEDNDKDSKQFISYSFSVKKDGTQIWTEGEVSKGGDLSFTPGRAKSDYGVSANGTYEVTYTATDRNNNVQSLTFSIKVGDVEKPTIHFTGTDAQNKANKPSGEYELNNKGVFELKIDSSKIIAKDDSDKFASSNANDDGSFKAITVYLSGPQGEVKNSGEVVNGVYTFKIDKTGDYTLRYSVTDEAGNYTSETYSFKVKEREGKTSVGTIFWSVALSILALCGLGVAIFFLLRDKNNKKGKKEKKDKNKQDDDKIVV